VLFGVEGLQVIDAGPGAEGTVEVWEVTDHLAAGRQPALRPGISAQLHSPQPATPEVSASRSHSRPKRGPSQDPAALVHRRPPRSASVTTRAAGTT